MMTEYKIAEKADSNTFNFLGLVYPSVPLHRLLFDLRFEGMNKFQLQ